jgi:hypothetical protein
LHTSQCFNQKRKDIGLSLYHRRQYLVGMGFPPTQLQHACVLTRFGKSCTDKVDATKTFESHAGLLALATDMVFSSNRRPVEISFSDAKPEMGEQSRTLQIPLC